MTTVELTKLRRAYAEVCRGYSEAKWRDETVYIKHLTIFDQTEIDVLQDQAFDEAVNKGVATEKDRLKWLEDKGMWKRVDENKLNGQRSYIEGLEKSKSKAALKIQVEALDKQLAEGRLKLAEDVEKRRRLIGLTAELVAEQKVQYEYIRLSFFKDRAFTQPLFTRADMRELYDDDSDYLLVTYIESMARFGGKPLRSIAVQPFFTNQFYLCEQVRDFFGQPVVDLTLHQTNLLSFGLYYRNVFKHHQIPKDMMEDPDKIDEYITRSVNAKKLMNAGVPAEGGRVGVVGARPEDFAAAGFEDGTQSMREMAKKGYTDARDVAKDHGYTIVDKR